MIGRHGNLNVYKEIFSSDDFIKVAVGGAFIPVAFLVQPVQVPKLPYVSLMDLILIVSVIINGVPIVINAAKGMLSRRLNVDELVAIAIVACLLTGNYLEAAVVSAIMVTGALIEEAVSDSARHAIEALVKLRPDTALADRDGIETPVQVADIVIGDLLIVKPGDIIPVDGRVMEGIALVNESAVTGEPIPKRREPGDSVWAGTLNTDAYIRVRAERVGEDSTIGKIIRMVMAAEQSQVGAAKIVDRYAAWFTPVILTAALATYLITRDVSRAVTVLIVGCPCSFLLAGPVATVSAIGRAAKEGILVKGGIYLENLARATGIFFDKTGTLTTGQPRVKQVVATDDLDADRLLVISAALEKKVNHPLASAILNKAKTVMEPIPEAVSVTHLPGRGVTGVVDGKTVVLETSNQFAEEGYTTVSVSVDDILKGYLCIEDQARETAGETVQTLREMGVEDVEVLSGDQEAPVRAVCNSVGIDRFYARQTPEDKLNRISGYDRGKRVYVGDGINDAPALKAAHTGIAMGLNGSDAALETADIVLMNDRLDKLGFLFALSRNMCRIIRINIFLSFLINAAAVAAGSYGLLTPIWGSVIHNAGSVLVVGLSASIGYLTKQTRKPHSL